MASQRYAAFLRGINVGGNNIIRMEDVRAALGATGCADVATILASGNIVFSSPDGDADCARERVERTLEAACGKRITALVRPVAHLRELVARDPFQAIAVTPETRLYVTFLPQPRTTRLGIPYRTPGGELTLLELSDMELLSVLVLGNGPGTVDVMSLIEKEFGGDVTTRSWNTVLKVVAKAG